MSETDGEKELVLGNKQIVGLFFVAVALCGVFFAMGYMIGHNTSRPTVASLESASPESAGPGSANSGNASPDGSAATPAASQAPTEAESPTSSPAAPVTDAPRDTPQTATQPAQPEPPSSLTPAAGAPTDRTSAAPPVEKTRIATSVPERGATYLQVTALRRTDADNLVRTLREQKFPALVAGSSKPDLFRVLVGPYHQSLDVAEAKERLKSLGFANAFVQK